MAKGSPLRKLSDLYIPKLKFMNMKFQQEKTVLLATNSLPAYFAIFTRVLMLKGQKLSKKNVRDFSKAIKEFSSNKIDASYILFVLYSGSSKCVAMDIESKCIEAGSLFLGFDYC
jgi:hypothetical protein